MHLPCVGSNGATITIVNRCSFTVWPGILPNSGSGDIGTTGFELAGPMGVSRLAWKDGVLLAKQTANARFEPPIPLVTVDGKDRKWSGRMESLGKFSQATAELIQKKEKIEVGSRQVQTVFTVLTVRKDGGTIELSSWFQPGVGLVQQEQRTGGKLILRMEMLGQPQTPP